MVDGRCIDCNNKSTDRNLCLHVSYEFNSIDLSYRINLMLKFNKHLEPLANFTKADLFIRFDTPSDSEFFVLHSQTLGQDQIRLVIQIKKSFITRKSITVVVPQQSRLISVDKIWLNNLENESLSLTRFTYDQILLPQQTERDISVLTSFDEIEQVIDSEDNLLMNILKYSFVLRFISDNQIMLVTSLMNFTLPMNLHLSTQAFLSEIKPQPERFGQSRREQKMRYRVLF